MRDAFIDEKHRRLDRVATALMATVKAVNDAHDLRHGDVGIAAEGSPAAHDMASEDLRPHIEDLLGKVNMCGVAALDHAHFVAENAERWATQGGDAYSFVWLSSARSAIESLAMLNWLVEPKVTAFRRAQRYLTVRRQEIATTRWFDLAHYRKQTDHIDELAFKLGFTPRRHERGPTDYGRGVPDRANLVEKLIDSKQLYPLLSSASHGEAWSLLALGYAPDPSMRSPTPNHTIVAKQPSFGVMTKVTSLVCIALIRASRAELRYRGWLSGDFDSNCREAEAILVTAQV